MKTINRIMPLTLALTFLILFIIGNGKEWDKGYDFFFLGGFFFFLSVYWIISAIENINIDDNE